MKQIFNLGLLLLLIPWLFSQPTSAQNAYNIADFASARSLGGGYEGDGGPALNAKFTSTHKMASDAQGNIYVTERLRVRRIDAATNIITTVAGDGSGSPDTPTPFEVLDLALDDAGNLYMANSRGNQVLRLNRTTGVITPVAGTGVAGFAGDGGLATQAQLVGPKAIALDATNNLYIVDGTRIRKVDAVTGIITTIAGSGRLRTDGVPALEASLALIHDLALDAIGNIYVVEVLKHRIRKIDAQTNIITTVAGSAQQTSNNPIGPATQVKLKLPHGVDVDAEGNIYIVDYYYARKVDAVTGMMYPIAGQLFTLSEPINGNATKTDFSMGMAVLVKNSKEVYVAERHWIRKLTSFYTDGLIVADHIEAMAGNTVKVPVRAKDLSALAGVQFDINIPSDKASFVGLTNINSKLTDFGTDNYNEVSAGKVRVLWANASMQEQTFQNNEVLFEIELNIPGNATTGDKFFLTFDGSIVVDQEAKTLKVGHKTGSVQIVASSSITGLFKTPVGQPIKGASMTLSRTAGIFDTHNATDSGTYIINGLVPGNNYQLVPNKPANKIDNGVDVGDVIAVRRHILQKELLNSPYKLIAADIDLSKSINVADILLMRRAILGMPVPLLVTWCFIPESFTFTDPTNPWNPSFVDSYIFTATSTQATQDFIGVKLGDVNYNATPTLRTSTQAVELNTPAVEVINGDVIRIPVAVGANYNQIAGFQGSLEFDPKVLQYQGVEAAALSINASQHFNTANARQGVISFLYDHPQGEANSFENGQILYYLTFKAIGNAGQSAAIKLTSSQTKATAYSQAFKGTSGLILSAGEVKLIEPVVTIFPNPAKNFNVQFGVTIDESKVNFILKDQQGKIVDSRETNFAKGQHTISFEPNVIAGNYFLTIEYNQHKITKKVMIK
ncbi:NHL domain-containing protein [Microscilla marina]|uniref:NHL domain-containing protein n=1 Tax=Microscilla marina TaxID=1027 RepID=UPI0005D46E9B|nr:cohesin domain-containing protein [Microscilla marina]